MGGFTGTRWSSGGARFNALLYLVDHDLLDILSLLEDGGEDSLAELGVHLRRKLINRRAKASNVGTASR
jgi:hypothetical protein